ncbi:MAG: radical SAM protein [Deltaproteobacteria bacterium RBG_16_48_10]|nr:MAG: radical SAM protein [Deltaproteobacteria bacterium RBG_16_48_10]
MILIHPPVTKPCEPPGGIGKLYGALSHHRVKCGVLDVNLEALLHLLAQPKTLMDTWGTRASRHLLKHLALLKSGQGYLQMDRYKRAVKDLNHLLELKTCTMGINLGLADYEDKELSPVKSRDLIRSAEKPEKNPFYPYFHHRLLSFLEREGGSIVGFSVNYLSQALSTFAMMGFLRRECPGIKIVLGGGLITSWMKRPQWQNPFKGLVNELVAGPGEDSLLSMNGVNGPFSKNHYTPNYDPFPFKDYLAPGAILPYRSSSGCYWNKCSFCPEKAEGNPYVPISPEKASTDLQRLVEEVNPSLIHFLDNAIPPALMKTIVAHPLGIPWYGFARVTRHLADLDFCMALKRSGCVMLKLGFESGDQNVLDALHKGIDLKEASRVLTNLKRAGIATYAYLLFGTPEEDLTEARRTLEFVVNHHDQIHFLNLALFNLPIDVQEASTVETKDFYGGDLSLYVDFEHPKGWHRRKVRQFLDKEFKRHPAIASILRKTPPIFTSNHAPFFVRGELRT